MLNYQRVITTVHPRTGDAHHKTVTIIPEVCGWQKGELDEVGCEGAFLTSENWKPEGVSDVSMPQVRTQRWPIFWRWSQLPPMIHSVQALRGHSSSKMDVVEDLLQRSHEAAGLDAERSVVHVFFCIGDSLIEMCVGQKMSEEPSLTIAKTVSDIFPHRLVSHVPGFKDHRLRGWPQTIKKGATSRMLLASGNVAVNSSFFPQCWPSNASHNGSFHHWILICWSNPCSLWWTALIFLGVRSQVLRLQQISGCTILLHPFAHWYPTFGSHPDVSPDLARSKSSRCWSKTMRSAVAGVWGVWLWIQQLTIEIYGLILPFCLMTYGVISYHRQNRDSSHDIYIYIYNIYIYLSDNSEPWGDGHPQRSSTKVQEFFCGGFTSLKFR